METNTSTNVSPYYNKSGVGLANASSAANKTKGSNLGIDDFLTLLTAQLSNQDMMNPSSDTEFIAQMAQFSSLQAMDSMAKIATLNQSTQLVGKNVIVATYDKNNQLITDEGIVEKVTICGSTPKIFVNGKEYEYTNVMEIKNVEVIKEEEKTEETGEAEGTNNSDNSENTDNSNNEGTSTQETNNN